MKKFAYFAGIFALCLISIVCLPKTPKHFQQKAAATVQNTPIMSIVIDDFGSYDQSGVDTFLNSNVPITAAVIPNTEFTEPNFKALEQAGKEIILHMPMEAHIYLPENWYGPIFIKNYDTPETAKQKLEYCLKNFPNIKGFNIHIGSGVSRNKNLMKAIYEFANEHGLYFLDSRTIETHAAEDACKETQSVYLGRDVFLEAEKNRSYAGVVFRLKQGVEIAKEKGYAIVIGHVGAEGGENTARAVIDSISEIEKQGVKIVPLSELFDMLKSQSAN